MKFIMDTFCLLLVFNQLNLHVVGFRNKSASGNRRGFNGSNNGNSNKNRDFGGSNGNFNGNNNIGGNNGNNNGNIGIGDLSRFFFSPQEIQKVVG